MKETLKNIFGCLSNLAVKSDDAKRQHPNDEETFGGLLGPFEVDSSKIINSKAFRRLADKTQVLTGPWNGLIRNRNSHTMEVTSIATSIAYILGLNVELTRAIALGHDIGHVPLGHVGEDFLKKLTGKRFGHEVFGPIVAQKVERKGRGMNLTKQTLSGIFFHSRRDGELVVKADMSQEAVVVMFADKIAYTTSDFNDFYHRLKLPEKWINPVIAEMTALGMDQRERSRKLICSLCIESHDLGYVGFKDGSQANRVLKHLRSLMYEIYPKVNIHGYEEVLNRLIAYLSDILGSQEKAILMFCLMTDKDVLFMTGKNTFDITDLELTSVWELRDVIIGLDIDVFDPCLDW